MSWAVSSDWQLACLLAAVVSSCAAAGLLACEFLLSRRITARIPGVFAGLLVAATAGVAALQQPLWIVGASGSVSILLVIACLLRHERAPYVAAQFMRPKAVWAILLCLSLVASRFLSAGVLNSILPQSTTEMDLADVPVLTIEGKTDKGQGIALFHFKMHSRDEDILRFVQQNEKDHAQLIRLREANPASNCHGWLFANGEYGIRDPEVDKILGDNGYGEVTQPLDGDVAVYRRAGEICHSGLVRIVDRHAPVLIESKWGPLGVYLHATSAQPFGGECRFYRTTRQSHTLTLSEQPIRAR